MSYRGRVDVETLGYEMLREKVSFQRTLEDVAIVVESLVYSADCRNKMTEGDTVRLVDWLVGWLVS